MKLGRARKSLFMQKVVSIPRRAHAEPIISKQVLDVKSDVGALKEDLLQIMNSNEKYLIEIKDEGDLVKENILNDMKLIKELLTKFLVEDWEK